MQNIPAQFLTQPFEVRTIPANVRDTIFRPGRQLQGMVTQLLDKQKFVFRVAKMNLVSTSPLNLEVGERIKVLVKENKPKLVLQIQRENAQETASVKSTETAHRQDTETLEFFFNLGENAEILEMHPWIGGRKTEKEKNSVDGIVLHLNSFSRGHTSIVLNQSEEQLFVSVSAGKFEWFQELKLDTQILADRLKTATKKAVQLQIMFDKKGRTGDGLKGIEISI